MNQLEVCKHCDFAECINVILNHPELVVKCIHFGNLQGYINSLELPSEYSMLPPCIIEESNQCGRTSFIYQIDNLEEGIYQCIK